MESEHSALEVIKSKEMENLGIFKDKEGNLWDKDSKMIDSNHALAKDVSSLMSTWMNTELASEMSNLGIMSTPSGDFIDKEGNLISLTHPLSTQLK